MNCLSEVECNGSFSKALQHHIPDTSKKICLPFVHGCGCVEYENLVMIGFPNLLSLIIVMGSDDVGLDLLKLKSHLRILQSNANLLFSLLSYIF